MKKIVFPIVIIILVALVFSFSQKQFGLSSKPKAVIINGRSLKTEIADTDEKRTRGLSGRKVLGEDSGLLFIFPAPSYYRFWMKEMKFPLDFIWIDKNTVVDTTENVPEPKSAQEKLISFTAGKPFDKVLEVNSGVVKKFNIIAGDKIQLL